MAKLPSEKLVIIDYSGTLSIEAPDFGCPGKLARALAESGLAAVGVTDADIFWEKIIFPTWDEGSRTTIGYARVIADRIAALHLPQPVRRNESAASCPQSAVFFSQVAEAAKRFVTMYLDHSRMDPLWRPLLEKLNADPKIVVVIATDHYAEATGAIIRYLSDWGIAATKAENIAGKPPVFSLPSGKHEKRERLNHVIVANSAELGFWKADRRFWEILKVQLPGRFRSVLIVDDFGFNEAAANGYGTPARVRERRLKTKALLREVFQIRVSTISFFFKKDEGDRKDARARKIRETVRRIGAAVRPLPA